MQIQTINPLQYKTFNHKKITEKSLRRHYIDIPSELYFSNFQKPITPTTAEIELEEMLTMQER